MTLYIRFHGYILHYLCNSEMNQISLKLVIEVSDALISDNTHQEQRPTRLMKVPFKNSIQFENGYR